MKAADCGVRSRCGSEVPKGSAVHLSIKEVIAAVRLAGAVAAAVFILTTSTAALFALQITEIIDSTRDGINNLVDPIGVAVDSAGNVYVVGQNSNNVFKIALGQTCTGDCNRNGVVTVDELLRCINIALETLQMSACSGGDADGDGEVTVDELLTAVTKALNGCWPTGADRR